jgi:hypothetical protein
LTEGFASRKMCVGPPKQGHLEKRLKNKPKIPRYGYDPKLRGGGEIVPPKSSAASYVAVLKWTESEHPRVPSGSATGGEFASSRAGGTGSTGTASVSGTVPRLGSTKPKPRLVRNISEAVSRILKGEVIELADVSQVHTVLEKLAAISEDAKKNGSKAPNYDLCNVTVARTNIFCGSALKTKEFPNGIPRIEMPQLSGTPVPGSAADKLPKNKDGEVNASQAFVDHLVELGVKVSSIKQVPAASLKASQSELVGPKVAGMMTNKSYDPSAEPIFVSKDGYVLDGHHRWAAVVGRDSEDGKLGQSKMNVRVIDRPMSELLFRSIYWTEEFGIAPKAAGAKKLDHYYAALLRFG